MRTLVLLCAVLCVSYGLKCYKDASKAEGHTGEEKQVQCVCGDYCVKYFAEGKGKEIAKDTHIKHETGAHGDVGVREERDRTTDKGNAHDRVVVEETRTEKKTNEARAASWDCGCSRTGGFQADMCKLLKEEGRGVFGENPQLEVTCCKGDLCNGAMSTTIFASILSLFAFYFWK